MDEILRFLRPAPPYKPKEGREDFIKNKVIIFGERPKSLTKVKFKYRLPDFEMDTELSKILEMSMDDVLKHRRFKIKLNADEYSKFFTNLLYAEEFYIREGLRMYDRQGVTMEEDGEYEGYVKLIMHGLAEKRPSVLPGDHILAVKCGDKEKAYQGFVHKIRTNSVVLKFGRLFSEEVDLSKARFDIRFTFNRVSMRRMHQALNNPKVDFRWLFPQNHQRSPVINQNINFHSHQNMNIYQERAVAIIKSGRHHPWPFIVFGPPGTGKSTTIVEAMLQLLDDNKTTTRILVCAASNAAANWLLKKLSQHLSHEKMVRVNAVSQNPQILDSELHRYCVIGANGKYRFPTLTYIETFQVVVTTCITAGAVYALGGKKPYTHIFVDEAGQALEPEILTAMQNASEDTRIILAGDPKQLGPLVRSPIAQKLNLGISLIERLSRIREVYDFCDTCIYGVKLRMNYRSHPDILSYPNTKFYEEKLIPCANVNITHNLINFTYLRTPYPLMFWCVKDGKEVQEGQSPSFFNAHEAGYVLAVVKQLLREGVRQEEIGVVTPYIKQVEKIRKLLTRKDVDNVEIGTVEKFQGQERRVIIISTVRTDSLGFIGDPRRFCVAATRAQALFVVIGDPKTLYLSELWGQWLDEVRSNGGYLEREFPDNVWYNP